MIVLDAFKGCLTLDARSVIPAMNSRFVSIPGRMTSQVYSIISKSFKDHWKLLYSEWF
jgi:hypothetical protein